MTEPTENVDADSSIGSWLRHEQGGPALLAFAERAGISAEQLTLLRNVPLARMLAAGGAAPDGVLDALVAQAAGGRAIESGSAARSPLVERIMPDRFEGRTIVVTGAASGIGRAVASRVAREGGRVVAVDLAAERLKALETELPKHEIELVAADLTSDEGIARIAAAAGPSVDGLANVAGLLDDFSGAHTVADDVLRRVFEVNVFAPLRLMRAVLPAMIDAGHGSIVNVASEAALRGSSAGIAYTSSKHAVVGLTRSAAFMYEPFGIRVNAVAPGGTLTGMRPTATDEFGHGRVMSRPAPVPIALPESLAASITFLLSDDGINVNGAVLPSDGGESVV